MALQKGRWTLTCTSSAPGLDTASPGSSGLRRRRAPPWDPRPHESREALLRDSARRAAGYMGRIHDALRIRRGSPDPRDGAPPPVFHEEAGDPPPLDVPVDCCDLAPDRQRPSPVDAACRSAHLVRV